MNSEELAVLRILYKHNGPVKLSTLIDGFPDEARSRIVDAVSTLQLVSFLNMIDCSSVLYVTLNRQARRAVLELLECDSKRSNSDRILENNLHLNDAFQLGHFNTNSDCSDEPDLKKPDSKGLWPRLPREALKVGTILVFAFVVLGTITALNSESTTTSSSTYVGYDEESPSIFASSLSLVTEVQKGKTVPIEHTYNSEHNLGYSDEPAVYEGIFTKLGSQPTSYDDPPLYYHYIISERKGLLLLEQIRPGFAPGDSNSSLTAMLGEDRKEFSTT